MCSGFPLGNGELHKVFFSADSSPCMHHSLINSLKIPGVSCHSVDCKLCWTFQLIWFTRPSKFRQLFRNCHNAMTSLLHTYHPDSRKHKTCFQAQRLCALTRLATAFPWTSWITTWEKAGRIHILAVSPLPYTDTVCTLFSIQTISILIFTSCLPRILLQFLPGCLQV